jgi:hypothetical protein
LVGPAGLAVSSTINHLAAGETVGILDVSPCLSHGFVSPQCEKRQKYRPIEHSVYIGRERLGRYVQSGPKKYRAFAANDRPLGNFRVHARVLAAIRKAARSARA